MNGVQIWNPARLSRARREAGLSQEGLARKLTTILGREAQPVRTRNIVRWERPRESNGAHAPHTSFIGAIAEATGKDVAFFLSEDEEEDHLSRLRRVRAELVRQGHDDLADDLFVIAESFSSERV